MLCVDDRSMWLYIVLSGYLRILDAPSVQTVAPYGYLFPTVYLFMVDMANPDLFVCSCRTWVCLDTTRFYEKQRQPSSGSAWPACPKHGKSGHLLLRLGGGGVRHNLHICNRRDSSTACRLCRLEPGNDLRIYTTHPFTETLLAFNLALVA